MSLDRARRAGTPPRSDHTIEQHLASVRNLVIFLVQQRHIASWASVDVDDVEEFLAGHSQFRKSLLTGLRQFFRSPRRPHPRNRPRRGRGTICGIPSLGFSDSFGS
jgi:hypothetical protein